MGPSPTWLGPYLKWKFDHRHVTGREKTMWRRPGDDRGRDWSDGAASQGHQGLLALPAAGRGQEGFSPASEGDSPADTLIPDFQPPELWDSNYLLFSLPSMRCFVTTTRGNQHTYLKVEALYLFIIGLAMARYFLHIKETFLNTKSCAGDR